MENIHLKNSTVNDVKNYVMDYIDDLYMDIETGRLTTMYNEEYKKIDKDFAVSFLTEHKILNAWLNSAKLNKKEIFNIFTHMDIDKFLQENIITLGNIRNYVYLININTDEKIKYVDYGLFIKTNKNRFDQYDYFFITDKKYIKINYIDSLTQIKIIKVHNEQFI